MIENPSSNSTSPERSSPEFRMYRENGIYRSEDITMVSYPTFDRCFEEVQNQQFAGGIVLLPELITATNIDHPDNKEVEHRLGVFSDYTKSQPDTKFVIGTPHFTDKHALPFNAVFVIQNGKRIATIHKRFPSRDEENIYSMDSSQPPFLLDGDTGILICSDIIGAGFPEDTYVKRTMYEVYFEDRSVQYDQLLNTNYIHPDAKRLVVPSIWGTGMDKNMPGKNTETLDGINIIYRNSLEYAVRNVFKQNKNIKEIFVCDKIPATKDPLTERTSTKPMSLVARK